MDSRDRLRHVVSQFLGVDAALLGPTFSIAAVVRNSISRATLQARLRKELAISPLLSAGIVTYEQLESVCLGTDSATAPKREFAPAPPAQAQSPGFCCGIDLQHAHDLPEAADYWEHTFYTDSFSPAEIAECISREFPREHFAARWAAKEALIKCSSFWSGVSLSQIELMKDERGRPALYDRRGPETCAIAASVSVSHTQGLAVAVVVSGPSNTASLPPAAESNRELRSVSSHFAGRMTFVALIVALASLILSLAVFFDQGLRS